MPRFKAYNYDQNAMVVTNYQDQPQPGIFEHAVHYLIEHKLDLSFFHPKYRNDATGRLVYDPAILLKIILFVYSKGKLWLLGRVMKGLERVMLLCELKRISSTGLSWALKWLNADIRMAQPDDRLGK